MNRKFKLNIITKARAIAGALFTSLAIATTALAAGGTVDGNIIAFTTPATEGTYHCDRQLVENKH